jgi:hypothetical protein
MAREARRDAMPRTARSLVEAWEAVAAVDHHCHPLLRWSSPLGPLELRAAFSEAVDSRIPAEHTPFTAAYRAVLRRLGGALACEPTEEAILAARAREDDAAYANRLLRDSGTGTMLLDHGFGGSDAFTAEEHRAQIDVPQRDVVRVETLAEDALLDCDDPETWFDAARTGLREAVDAGAVAAKTIVAYRAGLHLQRPDPESVRQAFADLRASPVDVRPRLAGVPLCHALVFEAAAECTALGVPLQVHCGFGDPDEDLALASPLGVRALLADPSLGGLKLLLLHCYPYHREAAYLCSVYPDVYMDLSLAIPLAAADGTRAMAEALGLCPWSKLLYATDASRLPEVYFVGAALHREALAAAFGELVGNGILTGREAVEAGCCVLAENAARVYALPAA